MESRSTKLALLAAAVAIAVALFVVLSDDDDGPAPPEQTVTQAGKLEPEGGHKAPKSKPRSPDVTTIEVKGGEPVGGVQKLSFESGDEVQFEVVSDIPEHVHVHGYDVIQDVTPGKPAKFEFPADIEGVFEVELEDSAVQIAELEVAPG